MVVILFSRMTDVPLINYFHIEVSCKCSQNLSPFADRKLGSLRFDNRNVNDNATNQ